jgi:threonine dehydrogenase-like Zn-dependent dehydrogenase
VYVGVTQEEIRFGHPLMHRRELTLLASRNAVSPDFTRIIQLIEDGKINTDTWITHHAALEEVPDVFPHWMNPENGVLKAMVSV